MSDRHDGCLLQKLVNGMAITLVCISRAWSKLKIAAIRLATFVSMGPRQCRRQESSGTDLIAARVLIDNRPVMTKAITAAAAVCRIMAFREGSASISRPCQGGPSASRVMCLLVGCQRLSSTACGLERLRSVSLAPGERHAHAAHRPTPHRPAT